MRKFMLSYLDSNGVTQICQISARSKKEADSIVSDIKWQVCNDNPSNFLGMRIDEIEADNCGCSKIKEFAMGALMFTGMAGVIGYAFAGLLGLI